MKTGRTLGGFLFGVVAALATSQVLSQDKGAAHAPDDRAKAMESWIASMKPGAHHRMLDRLVGTWDSTTRMGMGGPGTTAMETHGTMKRHWVLDGRFVLEEYESEMLMPDAATGSTKKIPWTGMGLLGYDNNRNLYVGCWADTMGTQLLTMKGTVDPTGKTFTSYGEMDEPSMGVFGRTVKYVTRIVDEDTHVFSIVDLAVGDDYKVVEVTYKRRK